ncbi:MAG: sel1 repeat family protein [Hyphomonadaceae bacterium]|nr:sel1 repeat family protein [Hyphomonadaceae bacterium]
MFKHVLFALIFTFLLPLQGHSESALPDHVVAALEACEGWQGEYCGDAGYYFARTMDPPDFDRAREIFQQGCDLDDGMSCARLAELYYFGDGHTVDFGTAFIYFAAACNRDEPVACSRIGHMYEKGKGVDADPALARSYARRACDMDDAYGCANYGRYVFNGDGGSRDVERGAELMDKGCDLGDPWACKTLMNIYSTGQYDLPAIPLRALGYAQASCGMRDAESCYTAGLLTQNLRGEDNASGAGAYFMLACELGSEAGCEAAQPQ